MAVAFNRGATLTRSDLNIFLTNAGGAAQNAYNITYALYYVDPGPPETEVLIGAVGRVPVNPAVGEYYASVRIPTGATVGNYRIRWDIVEYAGSPTQQVVQEFAVIGDNESAVGPTYTGNTAAMINSLRVLLRDQNPDKFYRFRPPEHEGTLKSYNRVFGEIWEDAELLEYLQRGLDWFNSMPPMTGMKDMDAVVNTRAGAWRTAILWGAISHACTALALNWIADEFDYSIGGISLSIEKSSKYESIKSNAESQFDKAVEAKARTVKIMRGLQQPRYGIGVRSALGPYVGRGVLSPRNYIG